MQIEHFLAHLASVSQSPDGQWKASCPSPRHQHGDRSRGLSVCTADDGSLLVHCFAGCHIELIVASMGLTLADLYPQPDRRPGAAQARKPRIFSRDIATALAHDATIASLALEYVLEGRPLSPDDIQSIAASSGRLFRFAKRMEAGQ